MGDRGRDVTDAAAITLWSQLLATILQAATYLVLVRGIALQKTFGSWNVLVSLITLAVLAGTLGIDARIRRFILARRTLEPDGARAWLLRLLAIRAAATFACVLAARAVVRAHGGQLAGVALTDAAWGWALSSLLFRSAAEILRTGVIEGLLAHRATGTIQVIVSAGRLLAVTAVILRDPHDPIPALLRATALVEGAGAVLLLAVLPRAWRHPPATPGPGTVPTLSRERGYTASSYAIALLLFSHENAAGHILVGSLRDLGEAGMYALAASLASWFLMLSPAQLLRPLLLPAFGRELDFGRPSGYPIEETLGLLFRTSIFVLLPAWAVACAMAGPAYLHVIARPDYIVGLRAFYLLSACACIVSLSVPCGMLIQSMERFWIPGVTILLGLAHLGAAAWLVPRVGFNGLVLTQAAAQIAMAAVLYGALRYRYVPGIRIPWRFLVRMALLSAPGSAVSWLLGRLATGTAGVLAAAAAGVGLSLVLGVLARPFPPEDRARLARLAPRLRWLHGG